MRQVQRIVDLDGDAWRQVAELLAETDQEFLPPLSRRRDTQSLVTVSGTRTHVDLDSYVAAMRSETILAALHDGSIVGLLSYIEGYASQQLADWSPSAYVTTISVKRHHRRHGVGRALYAALAEQAWMASLKYLTTRTWSTNLSHLGLLATVGFREVYRVSDARGPGVDTVGLACRLGPPGSLARAERAR